MTALPNKYYIGHYKPQRKTVMKEDPENSGIFKAPDC